MQQGWHAGLATGAPAVDAEHRLQVSLLDAVEQLARRGDDAALLDRTAAALVDFTCVHFRSEVALMSLYAYPEREAHAAEHLRLLDWAQEIRRTLVLGRPGDAIETLGAFRASLLAHLERMDREFARWCMAGAVRGVKSL